MDWRLFFVHAAHPSRQRFALLQDEEGGWGRLGKAAFRVGQSDSVICLAR